MMDDTSPLHNLADVMALLDSTMTRTTAAYAPSSIRTYREATLAITSL